jgi:apolipoprotein N-acyltransferase
VIDPAGRTTVELPADRAASSVASVRWMQSRTLYEMTGNLPPLIAVAIAGFFALRKAPAPDRRKQRKQRKQP